MQTKASRRFLGLWCFSQSLSWAKSSSFLDSCFRLTSAAASSFPFTTSMATFFCPSIDLAPNLKQTARLLGKAQLRVEGYIYLEACSKLRQDIKQIWKVFNGCAYSAMLVHAKSFLLCCVRWMQLIVAWNSRRAPAQVTPCVYS